MRLIYFAAGAAALLCGTGEARAQDRDACGAGLTCASDPASVLRAMEKAGLKPKPTADTRGDPLIESDEGPYHFDVYFYGCEANKNCDSLRFEVAFAKPGEKAGALLNKWNSTKRFLQVFIAEDGRLVGVYDVATIGGLTERNFADVLDWWKSQMGELADFFRAELAEKPGENASPRR